MFVVASHHKCASQFQAALLQQYAREKGLSYALVHGAAGEAPPLCDILFARNAEIEFCRQFERVLHIFRNPLDLVVSAYHSHLRTHFVKGWPELARQRQLLRRFEHEKASLAGLIATWVFLERRDFSSEAAGPLYALRRWDFEFGHSIRMEDLIQDPVAVLCTAAQGFFDPQTLRSVAEKTTFQSLAGDRRPGEVDNDNHYRSGLPGQWRREIPANLAAAIAASYSEIFELFYSSDRPSVLDALKSEAEV